MIRSAYLFRTRTGDQGTFGRLAVVGPDGVFSGFTCEQPWRDNERRFSCIPAGEYECEWIRSPHFGMVYHVKDVEGRTHILIHPGNVGGDRRKGFACNTLGCILVGSRYGSLTLNGRRQEAVLASRPALREFNTVMGHEPFKLIITEHYNHA